MSIKSLDRHIERTAGVTGGKPRIAGHRITVEHIVALHLKLGRSVDEICAEYGLGLAEVHAALAYYFDHRLEIDQSMREGEDFVAALRAATPSVLAKKLEALRGD